MAERPITATHRDYDAMVARWQEINDICDGKNVESKLVLPIAESEALKPKAKHRNAQFAKRVKFDRIAGQTVRGLIGMVFAKDPTINVPPRIDYVKHNIDGAGMSIYQQSQAALRHVVRNGRAGLFVDFPPVPDGKTISVAEMEAGEYFATVRLYAPEDITNWQLIRVGTQMKLGRVVLKEAVENEDGELIDTYRELKLEAVPTGDGVSLVYVVIEHYPDKDGNYVEYRRIYPRIGNSETHWSHIPFTFLGAQTNTIDVDDPPMANLCDLNIEHYNAKAILKDSVAILGQPQPYVTGLDEEDRKRMEKEGWVYGTNMMLMLPVGATFGVGQAQPNTLARQDVIDSVEAMLSGGARIIRPGGANKTATQVESENAIQHSILSLCAANVSEGYMAVLRDMCIYMDEGDTENIEYRLQQDFINEKLDPQMITALGAENGIGRLPDDQYLRRMQQGGVIDPEMTLEEYLERKAAMGRSVDMGFLGDDEGSGEI